MSGRYQYTDVVVKDMVRGWRSGPISPRSGRLLYRAASSAIGCFSNGRLAKNANFDVTTQAGVSRRLARLSCYNLVKIVAYTRPPTFVEVPIR
jgi:hypothetical protein